MTIKQKWTGIPALSYILSGIEMLIQIDANKWIIWWMWNSYQYCVFDAMEIVQWQHPFSSWAFHILCVCPQHPWLSKGEPSSLNMKQYRFLAVWLDILHNRNKETQQREKRRTKERQKRDKRKTKEGQKKDKQTEGQRDSWQIWSRVGIRVELSRNAKLTDSRLVNPAILAKRMPSLISAVNGPPMKLVCYLANSFLLIANCILTQC